MLFFLVMHKQNYFLLLLFYSIYFGVRILFVTLKIVTEILKCSATSQTKHRCELDFYFAWQKLRLIALSST